MRSIGFMTRHSDDSASLLFEKREARKWRGTGNRAVARATIMATIGKGGDTMNEIRISRRAALAGTAASALALSARPARAEGNWKKYAGTKLEGILAKGPRGDNPQKHNKEFTEIG